MAFFDQAQEMLSQGIDTARGAVSGVAMEQLGFVRGFVRLCNDGWEQGWHERNGGNLSYRLRPEDVDTARKFFDKEPRPWTPLGVEVPTMGGAYFLVTGTGNYMRNVASDPSRNIGIVELSAAGDAYRIVWGLDDGGRPTSEFPTHVMNHAVRAAATDGTCRVIYHAHPTNIIALSYLLPLDARTFTRVLWKAMTECVVVFPAGVGVVPWMVPGGADIARATSEQMKAFDAVVWASHGLFVSGADFDSTFGLLHTIEKAADIYGRARAMNGGSGEFLNTITDEGLRQIGREFNVKINEAMLDFPAASATDNEATKKGAAKLWRCPKSNKAPSPYHSPTSSTPAASWPRVWRWRPGRLLSTSTTCGCPSWAPWARMPSARRWARSSAAFWPTASGASSSTPITCSCTPRASSSLCAR